MNKSTHILLKKCGVPAHLSGYRYLGEAIEMVRSDYKVLKAITKVLYPSIAMKFDTTPARVERAIRHAIEIAFDNLAADEVKEIFGNTFHYSGDRPMNSHFIAALAEMVEDD